MFRRLEAIKTVAEIEKQYRKTKARVWKKIIEELQKPRRKRIEVNLNKLSKLGKKFKGKILVVPGKVLGEGEIDGKISVAALSFSKAAEEKIKGKGKVFSLKEILNKKPSQLVVVK
ncbi:MAG: 50S ribosomal protein L18e [Candidatus Diapherotrites archaeon]|nr:50S ribosomal protein L18e [Candidatus Diapherotrites archaeon]